MLVGWNSGILQSCGEASHKKLKKYISALVILIIMWAFTGFCFAKRYIQAPLEGCILTSLLFVLIVIQIERQIILTVGKARLASVFRLFIAILMALLSSSIIDQIIFADDINKKMIEIIDQQVIDQLPNRLAIIDSKLHELRKDIDSTEVVNGKLHEEYAHKPTLPSVTTITENKPVRRSDGSDTIVKVINSVRSDIPNPLGIRIEQNNKNIESFRRQEQEYTSKKLEAESNLREKFAAKTGFLEELNAILKIMSERKEALIFYIVLFLFLLFLELFVVVSKLADKKCDYDLIVEYQLETKTKSLDALKNTDYSK
jgi:hypothetical protein